MANTPGGPLGIFMSAPGSNKDNSNQQTQWAQTQHGQNATDSYNLFGGANHPGVFGGGWYVPESEAYNLPQGQTMNQTYQDLAMRAQGLTPPPPGASGVGAGSAGVDPSQAGLLAATGFKGGPAATQVAPQVDPWQQATPTGGQPGDWRGEQQQLASNLFGTIAGNQPSVAQQQLQQNTQANVANAYAMAQSGSANPAAARQAAMNAGNINQQGAGNAALLRAQEIQNAQGMLGNVLGTGRSQDTQATLGYLGLQQQGNVAQMGGNEARDAANFAAFQNSQANQLGARGLTAASNVAAAAAHFGSAGGMVPGYASGGDSKSNDTVPTMLSPGEVVIPRSITNAKDAAKKAAMFVEAIKRKHARKAA